MKSLLELTPQIRNAVYELYMAGSAVLGAVVAGFMAVGDTPTVLVAVSAGWMFLGSYVSRLAGKNVVYDGVVS